MAQMKEVIAGFLGSAIGICFALGGSLGWAYWMWMAVKLGSFGMFWFGIVPPFGIVAAVLGLWSFLFGIPAWLLSLVQ